jgi:hypothetical protein
MTFWGTVGAATIGGLIVALVPRVLSMIGRPAWKRHTPEGRGYARAEQLVAGILDRIPGEIIPPDPTTIIPPSDRRRSRLNQLAFIVGIAFVCTGLWMIGDGSDRKIATGTLGIAVAALFWAIYLSVSLEKRIEVIMADVHRIAAAVAPRQLREPTEQPHAPDEIAPP